MKHYFFFLVYFINLSIFGQVYSRAKIWTDNSGLNQLANLGVTMDHGQHKENTFFISDFSALEIEIARNAGFTVDILIEDVQSYYVNQNSQIKSDEKNVACDPLANTNYIPEVPSNFNLGTMGGFYTYQQYLDEIDAMAAQYPSLITSRSPISTFTSHEGRSIFWMRISDNASTDEAEPEVLYTAIHHAREPNSLSELVFYMWYLLENYDNSTEIQYLVNNTEMYFVPLVNPDGYIYNETTNPSGGGLWRKNRRNHGGGVFGVDLNRNYSYQWNTTGVSGTTTGDTWPGSAPFSEPETQAIKWFCENREFRFAFNAHTFDNSLLFPIGSTSAEFAEDHDYFTLFTSEMVKFNNYVNQKSSALYPASGDSDDYMYKVDTIIKPKIFAITPEVSETAGGFWPAISEITGICQDMVWSNLMLAHLTLRYLKVEDTDPNEILTLNGNFNHSATRLGLENGIVTVSITPLLNIASIGAAVVYNYALEQTGNGGISYTLSSGITAGSLVKYVLNTEYPLWTKHDTIVKTFGTLPTTLLDQATNGSNWTGTWNTTNATFYSPTTSFTDSPSTDYQNNTTKTYALINSVNLTNSTEAKIKFFAKWEIEADYDYCQFQVSIDNGANWVGQCGVYTSPGSSAGGSVQPQNEPVWEGVKTDWVQEEISLNDYLGETINLRFILKSDGGQRADGFYFDDFQIQVSEDESNVSENTKEGFYIFPNPTSGNTTLVFDQIQVATFLKVIDLQGRVVVGKAISPGDQQVELNTDELKAGIYNVLVTNENGKQTTKKLLKL